MAPLHLTPRDEIVQHLPGLRAFALSLTRSPDRADDLVQDTVEKAWKHIGSYTPGTNLRGWLCTILRNTHYSGLRKRRREVPDPDGVFVGKLSVAPAHDGVLALREFMVAFSQLSTEHRDAVSMVGVLGFSYEEAAAALSLPVGTVKSRVSRARAILAELQSTGQDGERHASRVVAAPPNAPRDLACAQYGSRVA